MEQEWRLAHEHHTREEQEGSNDLAGAESILRPKISDITIMTLTSITLSTRAESMMVTTGQENTMQRASGTGM